MRIHGMRRVIGSLGLTATVALGPALSLVEGCGAPLATQRPTEAASRPPQAAPTNPNVKLTLPNKDASVRFAVIGDTGTGGSAQLEVAKQLAAHRTAFSFDFAIMLGDNLYGGERPADYKHKFEIPYKPLLDAGVKFYAGARQP